MTENPKSCKIRVFQSENNYSPHHEHVQMDLEGFQ